MVGELGFHLRGLAAFSCPEAGLRFETIQPGTLLAAANDDTTLAGAICRVIAYRGRFAVSSGLIAINLMMKATGHVEIRLTASLSRAGRNRGSPSGTDSSARVSPFTAPR